MAETDCKRCAKCSQAKPRAEFGTCRHRKDGLKPYCKPCHNAANRASRVKNPEQGKAAIKAWNLANPEKVRAKSARWKANNPERVIQKRREFNERHRDRQREMWRQRRQVPEHRIHHTLSTRIRTLIGGKGGASTIALIGYSATELRRHLERQFKPGMGWHNYGDWHIDHIVPLSSFQITDINDPKIQIAWGLPNLRPLWAAENMSKKDKRTHLI